MAAERTAVVSGLGPNGLLATLQLHAAGFRVTALEPRPSYVRSIHLCLRRSWFDFVTALAPALAPELERIARPIERVDGPIARPPPPLATSPLLERLAVAPEVHVRLDELERVMRGYVASLSRVEVRASRAEVLATGEVVTDGQTLQGELVVVAEGGKSASAERLGVRRVKVSRPRFYLSVHVDHPVGAMTRRRDVELDGHQVSLWAVGHADPSRGTWLVLEVPAELQEGRSSHDFDAAWFERTATRLLDVPHAPAPSASGLKGTFRFEQQLLASPAVGERVLFVGDAAGMGHHALSTGLEVGAHDCLALAKWARGETSLAACARAVVDARVEVLACGMREYEPELTTDPTPLIRDAVSRA